MKKRFSITDMNGDTGRSNDKGNRSLTNMNGKTMGDEIYNWRDLNGKDQEKFSLNNMCGYTDQDN